MEVLLALAGQPGRVVSRQELEQEAWPGRIVTDDAVTNAVGKLRRALYDNPRQPRLIETIAKRGYRLKVEPKPLGEDTTASGSTESKGASQQLRQRRWMLAGALVFAAVGLIAIWFWRSPDVTRSPKLERETAASVAVMPFDVLGDDPSQTYFAEGISLDLIWSRLAVDAHGALSTAIGHAERAASIDPSVPQIYFVQAQVALFRGQHEKAAAAATRAIELDPNYADAYALLAWILHYAGRPDQAGPMLAAALKRNPRSSASYREIAGEIAFTTGRYVEAAQHFEAAPERNPAHTRARLWLAATLVKLGRRDEAEWEVQELLTLNPEFDLSRLLLAFPLKDRQQSDDLLGTLTQLGLPE